VSRANKVTYDHWLEHLFSEFASKRDQQEVDFPDTWYSNPRILVEHYTHFLEDPVPVVQKFGNELTGEVLWGLASTTHNVSVEVCHLKIPLELRDQAILAMGSMIRKLAPQHLTRKVWDSWDKLDSTIFMYWDIAPVWPAKGTDHGRALLEVCLAEMQDVLLIEHPVAQLHALHGLSEFHINFPSQTKPIVDAWIADHPHISPKLMEYAQHASDGLVQ